MKKSVISFIWVSINAEFRHIAFCQKAMAW
jgi:hypothetical protein